MTGAYAVVLADPPWQFRNVRTGGSMRSGAAQKYATLSTGDLCRMPVRDIAARNSILFLWGTSAMLPDAHAVMDAWGYRHKGSLIWVKAKKDGIPFNGMGYHIRNAAEFVLFGFRGKVPALRCQRPNVVRARVRGHSEKPPEMWDLIEAMIDGRDDLTPRIELFARGLSRPGWDAWGDQALGGVRLPTLDAWTGTLPVTVDAAAEGATA
jgi:N6-adenosine-specific RNA methylase IME4